MEKDGLLDFSVLKKITFVSDNGAPYHGGEWLATLLGIQTGSFGHVADEFFCKFQIDVMFLVTGEGKGLQDAHFSMISRCEKVWVNKGSEDSNGQSSLNKLTEQTMPDLMAYCQKWIGSTRITQLPEGFRKSCPHGGHFVKVEGVKGLHQFWKDPDGTIKARSYADFGPVKTVRIGKGKRQANKKRGAKIDARRKAAVNAVQWFDRTIGRHQDWVNPEGGTPRCRSEAWGLVSCERFVKATEEDSPFSKTNMLCYDSVKADLVKLVNNDRYKGKWKPIASSTPHTIFEKVGALELLYLGSIASPPIPWPADLEPSQAHVDVWDALESKGELPYEGKQTPTAGGNSGAAGSGAAGAPTGSVATPATTAAAASLGADTTSHSCTGGRCPMSVSPATCVQPECACECEMPEDDDL
eukprot:COSAG01_NODE_6306_length_3745_cov_3.895776_3_plen_412_part_00